MVAAWRRGGRLDRWTTYGNALLIGLPLVVLGLLLQHVLAVRYRLLPLSGTPPQGLWHVDVDVVLPALTMALADAAVLVRLFRGSLLEVHGADHLRTARAKGVSEWRVFADHTLRLALLPAVTYLGVTLATLLAGAVVVETLFDYDGIGRALVVAVSTEDNPVVVGVVLYSVVAFVVLDLVIDVLYAVLDPRVRVEAL